ncbi:MAG TPA: right-handed parallel beta-helix repeat-containing protein [Candidatus Acidoferrum sp.]|nr:right-handed parallel beta-helix repeat-containing protein [Candidatus Acidoferrum sp.]
MNAIRKLLRKGLYLAVPMFLLLLFSPGVTRAQQYLIVDCTGANTSAYPSINAALPNATPGSFILVTGPCNENVSLNQVSNLNLGAYYGQTAVLNGGISITNSDNVFLYGLNVTNASGNGISVSNSRGIQVNVCSSSGNSGFGLNVGGMSDVTVGASGAFSHNGNYGIYITGNSLVSLVAWAGPVDISNNLVGGVFSSQGNFSTLGPTTITNNVSNGPNSGFGINLLGGARAQVGALFGPNTISGNPGGGASLGENAEISFWNIGPSNLIQNNGPVGISAGLNSQVTVYNISGPVGAVISDHTSAGVEVYANSQANFFGPYQVMRNGSATDPRSAGIRLDGNSEAYMRGGQVTQNNGPGILALVNSSADFTGVTLSGNAGGQIINCDTSSWMVSDLTKPGSAFSPAGVACRTPHMLGNRAWFNALSPNTDWSVPKARFDTYAKFAVKH